MKIKQIVREFKERTPGYFDRRFPGHFAQISTVMTLKLKSAVLDVARFTYGKGQIPPAIIALSKKMMVAPQGVSDDKFIFGYENSGEWEPGSITYDPALQEYVRKYPQQWEIVQKALKLGRGYGRHASAFIITGRPIEGYIPTTIRDGLPCTQYEAVGVESVGAIKYDLLVINSLNDIQLAIKLIQDRSGLDIPSVFKTKLGNSPRCNLVPINGTFYDIWSLPTDLDVYEDISLGKTETVFQLATTGARKWLKYFEEKDQNGQYLLKSIQDLADFTALDRPGPLEAELDNNMGGTHNVLVEYVQRRLQKEESPTVLPAFKKIFPETNGLIVYQEQVQKAYQFITGCSGTEADEFRSNVGKKKKEKILAAYPKFMERAIEKLGDEELAHQCWNQLNEFGAYGFNKSMTEDTILDLVGGVSKQIKDVIPGDLIECFSDGEFKETEIVALHDHGILEAFEIEFDDGTKVACSMNHKFLTKFGMKPLHEIISEELEIIAKEKCESMDLSML